MAQHHRGPKRLQHKLRDVLRDLRDEAFPYICFPASEPAFLPHEQGPSALGPTLVHVGVHLGKAQLWGTGIRCHAGREAEGSAMQVKFREVGQGRGLSTHVCLAAVTGGQAVRRTGGQADNY